MQMNPKEIKFWVAVTPPKTTHQSKFIARGGRRLINTEALNTAKAIYAAAFRKHAPPAPIGAPVELEIQIVFPHRQRTPKFWRGKTVRNTTRPDATNLAKTIEDILVDLRFISDDNGVSDIIVRKRNGDTPGIFVRITQLEYIDENTNG